MSLLVPIARFKNRRAAALSRRSDSMKSRIFLVFIDRPVIVGSFSFNRLLRPRFAILNGLALSPFGNCLRVDPKFLVQRRDRSLRSLYCCSDSVR